MWLNQNYKGKITHNANLGSRTWFRAGGNAEFLFEPKGEKDIEVFLKNYPQNAPLLVMGAGSNMLIRDGGVKGVTMILPFVSIKTDGAKITAGSNVPAASLSQAALKAGISGFEFMRGIPGTIGGCLAMNASAYDRETADIFSQAIAFDRAGNFCELNKKEMKFSYRVAISNYIFIYGVFEGQTETQSNIKEKMEKVIASRKSAQPPGARTSGSTFKNPSPKQTIKKAWQLIDEAKCREFFVGEAQVCAKHCNFLINNGNASATDIENLGEKIRKQVKIKTDIDLEWEIHRVGVK